MNNIKTSIMSIVALSMSSLASGQVIVGGDGVPNTHGTFTNDSIFGLMAVWGQTIHTPDELNTNLEKYTLYFSRVGGYESVSFTTAVVEWDVPNSKPVDGSLLWSSAHYTANQEMSAYSFVTGGLALNVSKTYLLVAIPDFSNSGAYSYIGGTTLSYPGVLYAASSAPGTDFSAFTDVTWFSQQPNGFDLLYTANFSVPSAVPEPPTYTLLFGGLIFGLTLLRKKRVQAEDGLER